MAGGSWQRDRKSSSIRDNTTLSSYHLLPRAPNGGSCCALRCDGGASVGQHHPFGARSFDTQCHNVLGSAVCEAVGANSNGGAVVPFNGGSKGTSTLGAVVRSSESSFPFTGVSSYVSPGRCVGLGDTSPNQQLYSRGGTQVPFTVNTDTGAVVYTTNNKLVANVGDLNGVTCGKVAVCCVGVGNVGPVGVFITKSSTQPMCSVPNSLNLCAMSCATTTECVGVNGCPLPNVSDVPTLSYNGSTWVLSSVQNVCGVEKLNGVVCPTATQKEQE
jgi:hypothetical protein